MCVNVICLLHRVMSDNSAAVCSATRVHGPTTVSSRLWFGDWSDWFICIQTKSRDAEPPLSLRLHLSPLNCVSRTVDHEMWAITRVVVKLHVFMHVHLSVDCELTFKNDATVLTVLCCSVSWLSSCAPDNFLRNLYWWGKMVNNFGFMLNYIVFWTVLRAADNITGTFVSGYTTFEMTPGSGHIVYNFWGNSEHLRGKCRGSLYAEKSRSLLLYFLPHVQFAEVSRTYFSAKVSCCKWPRILDGVYHFDCELLCLHIHYLLLTLSLIAASQLFCVHFVRSSDFW